MITIGFTTIHAQESSMIAFDKAIKWEKTMEGKMEFWGAPYFPWTFDGAAYDGQTVIFPVFCTQIPVSRAGEITWKIRDVEWMDLTTDVIPPELETELNPQISVLDERGEQFIQIRFQPLVKSGNGLVKAVRRISLALEMIPGETSFSSNNERDLTLSALSDGTIYKITVATDGIYKLDQEYLTGLGIDLKNLNPSKIKVFGSDSGPVPELIATQRVEDLDEVPLQGFGLEDGRFDQND
ncbi:MAG TPA: hypothetical protein DCX89_04400, partial [Saprospirales bacterium]|nr:hypothetical protein [Saprospirales bacterium]